MSNGFWETGSSPHVLVLTVSIYTQQEEDLMIIIF